MPAYPRYTRIGQIRDPADVNTAKFQSFSWISHVNQVQPILPVHHRKPSTPILAAAFHKIALSYSVAPLFPSPNQFPAPNVAIPTPTGHIECFLSLSCIQSRLEMTSELRRRAVGPEPSLSTPPAPRDQSPVKPGDKVKIVHQRDKSPARKRRSTFIFFLGSLFGLIAAGFLAQSNDLIEFPELGELSMDSLLDVLPSNLVADLKDLVVRFETSNPARRLD